MAWCQAVTPASFGESRRAGKVFASLSDNYPALVAPVRPIVAIDRIPWTSGVTCMNSSRMTDLRRTDDGQASVIDNRLLSSKSRGPFGDAVIRLENLPGR